MLRATGDYFHPSVLFLSVKAPPALASGTAVGASVHAQLLAVNDNFLLAVLIQNPRDVIAHSIEFYDKRKRHLAVRGKVFDRIRAIVEVNPASVSNKIPWSFFRGDLAMPGAQCSERLLQFSHRYAAFQQVA